MPAIPTSSFGTAIPSIYVFLVCLDFLLYIGALDKHVVLQAFSNLYQQINNGKSIYYVPEAERRWYVTVAAPGGFLEFLETGQTLLAINNFFSIRIQRYACALIISGENSRRNLYNHVVHNG